MTFLRALSPGQPPALTPEAQNRLNGRSGPVKWSDLKPGLDPADYRHCQHVHGLLAGARLGRTTGSASEGGNKPQNSGASKGTITFLGRLVAALPPEGFFAGFSL